LKELPSKNKNVWHKDKQGDTDHSCIESKQAEYKNNAISKEKSTA
jgi:hypothetical protein